MANPSANQNRLPRPGAYRYFACASWVWLVPRAKEVAAARTAGPVSPGFSLDTESPTGELAPPPLQACRGGGANSPVGDSVSSEKPGDTGPAVLAAATSFALGTSQTQEAQAK